MRRSCRNRPAFSRSTTPSAKSELWQVPVGSPESSGRRAFNWGLSLQEANRVFVEMWGDEIIVTALGFASYSKPSRQPQILRRRSDTDDYELLAKAWQAANEKARKLGWLV
jgi:hypothetical protein